MSIVLDDNQARINISSNVKLLLSERAWTQARLAKESGETPMMISRVCKGVYTPNAVTLARIAEVLRTSVDWILADHSTESKATA